MLELEWEKKFGRDLFESLFKMGDEQETPSVKGLQESFWFHREDDEDFVDNLSIRKGLDVSLKIFLVTFIEK